MALLEREHGSRPTVLFNNIEGHPGKRILMNPFRKCIVSKLLVGDTLPFLPEIRRRLKTAPLPTIMTNSDRFIQAENKLNEIPILKHQPGDANAYITAGITATKCPETNLINLGIYRLQYVNRDTLLIFMNPKSDGYRNYKAYVGNGEKAPVSIFIGAEPEFYLVGAGGFASRIDSYAACSMVSARAISLQELQVPVPCSSQYIICGHITDKHGLEGKFGEFKGFYCSPASNPILEVDKVYFKEDAFYTSIIAGEESGLSLMAIPNEIRMFNGLGDQGFVITNIRYLLKNGLGEFTVVIETPNPEKSIIQSAWKIDARVKFVICGTRVLDPWRDINIFPVNSVYDTYVRSGRPDGEKVGFILNNTSDVEWVEFLPDPLRG